VALAPTEVIRPGYERGRLARWWALPAAALIALGASIAFLIARGDHPQATAPTAAPPTNAAAPTTTAPPTTAVPPTTAALAITAAAPVGPTSSVSVSPTTRQVADPSTIDGIIVMLQADPAGFGQRAGDVIRDLDKIRSGKGNVGRRAEDLLEHVGEWVENGELDPTVLALLEPVVGPLTEDDEADHGD
jgi:hypothetical protein